MDGRGKEEAFRKPAIQPQASSHANRDLSYLYICWKSHFAKIALLIKFFTFLANNSNSQIEGETAILDMTLTNENNLFSVQKL